LTIVASITIISAPAHSTYSASHLLRSVLRSGTASISFVLGVFQAQTTRGRKVIGSVEPALLSTPMPDGGERLGPASGPSDTGSSRDGEPRLVEREDDLVALRRAIDLAGAADGSVVFVEGAAGIGKTALLAAGVALASGSGLAVLTARCRDLERDFPHGVVRQLVEACVRAVDVADRDRLFAGPAAHATDLLLSKTLDNPLTTPGDGDFAAIHGLYWLAANLAAERPLMIVIDDAHWADAASLRFASYLANRLAGLSVLLLVAARSDEPAANTAILRSLATVAGSQIRLRALSPAGTAAVVGERMTTTDTFTAACHASSGGNPFLLQELLSAILADRIAGDEAGASLVRQLTPKSVSRAVFLRLARLPPKAAELARAVAILGDHVELSDAARLAGMPPRQAAELSDALASAGVLATTHPLRFVHPMILEAVAGDLGPGERVAMHARAAELLHARGADAEQVAAHLSAGGPFAQPWAVGVLRRVAHDAMARGAPEVAQRHLERALREDHPEAERGRLLAELGEALWLAGDKTPAAIARLEEASRVAGDTSTRTRATILLARAIFSTGDCQGATATLVRALDGPDDLDRETRLQVEAALGSICVLNLQELPDIRVRLEGFGEIAGRNTDERLMLCNLAVLAWHFGTSSEAAELARRALAEGQLLAAVGSDNMAFLQAVITLIGADWLDEARAIGEVALADARSRGSAFGFATNSQLAAMTAIRAGDVREAEAHARGPLDLPTIPPITRLALLHLLAWALVELGELDEAEQALEDGLLGPGLPVLVHMNDGFYVRGLLRAAQDRDEDALADFLEFGRRQAICLVDNPAVAWRTDAARACGRLGRVEHAETLLDSHDAIAARWGADAAVGLGVQARAVALGPEDRVAMLERAHELLAGSPRRLDAARALFDLGCALRRAGHRRSAQRRLSEAVAAARRCGATRLARRANEELGVLTTRPRKLQFSGVESLTASERRVAMMAAGGLTNQQVAQQLFVTRKTIETHLASVFIKLAIKSRTQLKAALGESDDSAGHREI
jgi:DNA-binding CsgD family transcriptional regulator